MQICAYVFPLRLQSQAKRQDNGRLQRHIETSSRDIRTCSLTILDSSRSSARWPPFQALRLTRSLPSSDLGPVDLAHGLQLLISSACRCLRSNVQGVAMLVLQ